MKKRIFALILATVCVCSSLFVFASCKKSEAQEIEGFKNITKDFENTDKLVNFKFYVPENWIVDAQSGFVSAKHSDSDPSNISVMVFSISESILKYHDQVKKEYEGEETELWLIESSFRYYIDGIKEIYKDYELESSSSTLLDKRPAKKYIYTAKLLENEYKYLQVFCKKNNEIYLITFTTTANKFDSHIKTVEKMLEYFKFD